MLTGGRLTGEDAYAYSKFARVALGTNDIDFRARAHSAEEADFLASHVVAKALDVTYADLEKASVVVLAGLEPEDESPIVFLRLRKASRKRGTKVVSIAPFTSRGLQKMNGSLVRTAPGDEVSALEALAHDGEVALDGGGVILVGERLATVPGALSAALTLAGTTGARLAWVPRRAGERGALETGCLPTLLPGGRPVADAAARVDLGTVWGTTVPHEPGRDGDAIVAAAAAGDLAALVVAGVDPVDLPDPAAAQRRARERRLRGQPRGARQRRLAGRGRRLPGRPGGREGRHVRGLGGPGPPVREGAARLARAAGPAGAGRHRRRDGRRPRLQDRRGRPRRDAGGRRLGRRPRPVRRRRVRGSASRGRPPRRTTR